MLDKAVLNSENNRAIIFGYYVKDPKRYGVINFDKEGIVTSIEEKPVNPQSNYAVTSIYFYPNSVIEIAKSLKPSSRGELEIPSINQKFLEIGNLDVELMGRGFAWLDTGTHDSFLEASNFVYTIEKRQGLKIACLEETAYRKAFINNAQLVTLANNYSNEYGEYLLNFSLKN
jgi:glucose-1-phosphate thymidylyltransferase